MASNNDREELDVIHTITDVVQELILEMSEWIDENQYQ